MLIERKPEHIFQSISVQISRHLLLYLLRQIPRGILRSSSMRNSTSENGPLYGVHVKLTQLDDRKRAKVVRENTRQRRGLREKYSSQEGGRDRVGELKMNLWTGLKRWNGLNFTAEISFEMVKTSIRLCKDALMKWMNCNESENTSR